MKKLISIITLSLLLANTGFANELIFQYSEKLSDKKLDIKKVVKICDEYKKKNIDAYQYDQATINTHLGIFNFCNTAKIKNKIKQKTKYNLIKELDIEKFNFNYFSSEDYSMIIPDSKVTKKSTCSMNLKKERKLDYKKIKEICGIEKIFTKEVSCSGPKCSLVNFEFDENDELEDKWLVVTDFFYGDINNDDYMDLIIRFKNGGSQSAGTITMTTVVTSLKKNKYKNLAY